MRTPLLTVLKWTVIALMAYLEWADGAPLLERTPDSSECERVAVVAPMATGGGDAESLVTEPGCQATSDVAPLGREATTSGVTLDVCDGVRID